MTVTDRTMSHDQYLVVSSGCDVIIYKHLAHVDRSLDNGEKGNTIGGAFNGLGHELDIIHEHVRYLGTIECDLDVRCTRTSNAACRFLRT